MLHATTPSLHMKNPAEALQVIVDTITLTDNNRSRFTPELQVHACITVIKSIPAAREVALIQLGKLLASNVYLSHLSGVFRDAIFQLCSCVQNYGCGSGIFKKSQEWNDFVRKWALDILLDLYDKKLKSGLSTGWSWIDVRSKAQMPRSPDAQKPRWPEAQMPRSPDAQIGRASCRERV